MCCSGFSSVLRFVWFARAFACRHSIEFFTVREYTALKEPLFRVLRTRRRSPWCILYLRMKRGRPVWFIELLAIWSFLHPRLLSPFFVLLWSSGPFFGSDRIRSCLFGLVGRPFTHLYPPEACLILKIWKRVVPIHFSKGRTCLSSCQ